MMAHFLKDLLDEDIIFEKQRTLEMAAALPRAASGRVGVAHLLFRWHKYIYRIV